MFQVTVPANHKGGDSLTVAAPDGSQMMSRPGSSRARSFR